MIISVKIMTKMMIISESDYEDNYGNDDSPRSGP